MDSTRKRLDDRERALLQRARRTPYRTPAAGPELEVHFYLPRDLEEGPPRPAFLFFHAGAWDRGSVAQFAPQALYFAERGAVCGLVEYRTRATHPHASPEESLDDGLEAVHLTRRLAGKLHLDPAKLVVFGAAAGANIAAHAVMEPARRGSRGQSTPPEEAPPNGAVIFSPILKIDKGSYGSEAFAAGGDAQRVELERLVRGGLPPMLILHGTADGLVPCEGSADFAAKLARKGNPCEFVEFEGRGHGFFNLNTDPASYEASLATVNDFLDRHGFLKRPAQDDALLISWRDSDY